MLSLKFVVILGASLAQKAAARTFTVYNACPFTIWPAMFTDLNVAPNVPAYQTGWEAAAYTAVSFSVPDNWKAGRIWGVPPATVAEWTLQGDGNQDFYDVSLVDGYNLPMSITNNKGCHVANCAVDLGPNCPDPLKGPFDSTGFPVGCKSACSANLDGNPGMNSYLVSFRADNQSVSHSYFKGNCPNSYAYAYDESSGTAIWTCDSGLNADYTLTFCP
ncbi:hypothetical protein EWM64_g20 [Hericium alpestre]|uniref:Thaumatin-like protein n=1 Tax=Hericium alpestre TaxID=135208 RepID=A0A4Z0AC37_9AGAM|nr:hypothetical protein EWM64_g20 [Hericium alpestre]